VNGLLVAPRDAAALASAIVRGLKDEGLRQRMGEAGFARVRERFTVERMVEQTSAVYARVAGRHRVEDTASPPGVG
jgi:glycosyltransferase involved in cell wall biosynthesis